MQYLSYCRILEDLVFLPCKSKIQREEIELLTLLIHDYQERLLAIEKPDVISVLKNLMQERGLNASLLAQNLGLGKSYISEVLNKKKTISLNLAGKLASFFAVSRDLFLMPYAKNNPEESALAAKTKSQYSLKSRRVKKKK